MIHESPETRSEPIHDALVVGGGLVGPVLALALAREGLGVALIDARPPSGNGLDGRAYALAVASRRLLSALGLWKSVAGEAQPILGIRVTDGRPGEAPSPLHLAFDAAEIEEGPMGHMVEDRHLRPALEAALAAEPRVARIHGTVTTQETTGSVATVTLADGQQLLARVLIGADGRGSATGRRAGLRRTEKDYGQSAVTAIIAHESAHDGVAQQLFLPGGPLAILPLVGRRSSIVWSVATARADTLMAMEPDAFLAALLPVIGSYLGAIGLEGARHAYPLGRSLAQALVAPRVALVGDAAHAVHPLAGQGLNAGLRDVAALAEVLGDARGRGEDLGSMSVLEDYARWRRFDNAALAMATDGIDRLFSNDAPALRLVRDIGLGLVNRVGPLRRAFIREAAGLTGDLPRLMR